MKKINSPPVFSVIPMRLSRQTVLPSRITSERESRTGSPDNPGSRRCRKIKRLILSMYLIYLPIYFYTGYGRIDSYWCAYLRASICRPSPLQASSEYRFALLIYGVDATGILRVVRIFKMKITTCSETKDNRCTGSRLFYPGDSYR